MRQATLARLERSPGYAETNFPFFKEKPTSGRFGFGFGKRDVAALRERIEQIYSEEKIE